MKFFNLSIGVHRFKLFSGNNLSKTTLIILIEFIILFYFIYLHSQTARTRMSTCADRLKKKKKKRKKIIKCKAKRIQRKIY